MVNGSLRPISTRNHILYTLSTSEIILLFIHMKVLGYMVCLLRIVLCSPLHTKRTEHIMYGILILEIPGHVPLGVSRVAHLRTPKTP